MKFGEAECITGPSWQAGRATETGVEGIWEVDGGCEKSFLLQSFLKQLYYKLTNVRRSALLSE